MLPDRPRRGNLPAPNGFQRPSIGQTRPLNGFQPHFQLQIRPIPAHFYRCGFCGWLCPELSPFFEPFCPEFSAFFSFFPLKISVTLDWNFL